MDMNIESTQPTRIWANLMKFLFLILGAIVIRTFLSSLPYSGEPIVGIEWVEVPTEDTQEFVDKYASVMLQPGEVMIPDGGKISSSVSLTADDSVVLIEGHGSIDGPVLIGTSTHPVYFEGHFDVDGNYSFRILPDGDIQMEGFPSGCTFSNQRSPLKVRSGGFTVDNGAEQCRLLSGVARRAALLEQGRSRARCHVLFQENGELTGGYHNYFSGEYTLYRGGQVEVRNLFSTLTMPVNRDGTPDEEGMRHEGRCFEALYTAEKVEVIGNKLRMKFKGGIKMFAR